MLFEVAPSEGRLLAAEPVSRPVESAEGDLVVDEKGDQRKRGSPDGDERVKPRPPPTLPSSPPHECQGRQPEQELRIPDRRDKSEEQAGEERLRQLALQLCDRDREKLIQIEEALERIRRGTYGYCEECGDPIEEARLEAMPLAKYCLACQSELEQRERMRGPEREFVYRGAEPLEPLEEEEE